METSESSKKRWGGKREGAGRKATVHGKYVGFNSTLEVERILETFKGSAKTEFINAAIMAHARTLGLIE